MRAQPGCRASRRSPRCSSRRSCWASSFRSSRRPTARPTTYVAECSWTSTSTRRATPAEVARVRDELERAPHVEEHQVRLKAAGLRTGEQDQPAGLRADRLQPAAGHPPHHALQPRRSSAALRKELDQSSPLGTRLVTDPAIAGGAEPPGADRQDPLGHAHRQDHDGAARGAARASPRCCLSRTRSASRCSRVGARSR